VPDVPVEVLGLPLNAPWLSVAEAIDYLLKVRPKVAIPVHDALLNETGLGLYRGVINRFAEPEAVELRVVPNGTSTEV
jgi:hypothetical protein